jgi:hypothetical protein
MIARALWDGLRTVLDFAFGLLPSAAFVLPRWNVTLSVPGWLPTDTVVATSIVVVAWLVILGGYAVFSWIWRHIPTVFGFGTGSG